MSKDPAFLFYSKDFYEGTRMMLPEERACYIDLLIYQHQNEGYIPTDLKRLRLYCSGIDEATLEATLQAKFTLTDNGWHNEKLGEVISNRKLFSEKQSINGKIGQFFKKSKALLSFKDYQNLRELLLKNRSNESALLIINKFDQGLEINKAMLQAMLKHLANAIENVIVYEEEDLSKKVKVLKGEKIKLTLPFDTETFRSQWQLWKTYKKDQFSFTYKSISTEQAALTTLSDLSDNDEKSAIRIINQSISQGWKGFFKLKTDNQNGSINTNQNRRKQATFNLADHIIQPADASETFGGHTEDTDYSECE